MVCVAIAQSSGNAFQAGSLFTPEERGQILEFWSAPNRYVVTPPTDCKTKGLWQVRQTPEASVWLWNYNKLRKVSAPPTADAQPANDQQKSWEAWLVKKLNYDRWQAWQSARLNNQQVLGIDAPPADKGMPATEPPPPGPEPTDMELAVGSPPSLAQAVVPMHHTVNFDDIALPYVDNVKLGNPRYPYYRFGQGVNSNGQAVSGDRLAHLCQLASCSDSESRIMQAVSRLEGGFDSVNTYDTGFVSVGFIQFASLKEGGGSLGGLLLEYKQDDPTDFATDFHKFGIEVGPTGILDVVDPSTGAEVTGPDANARIIWDKRLVAVFQRAGLKSDPFCAAQIKAAKTIFYPAQDSITCTCCNGTPISGKVGDFIKSEAGLATLFDRKVNTGNISQLAKVCSQVCMQHKLTAIDQLAAYEREIVAAMKYREDFLQDGDLSQPSSK